MDQKIYYICKYTPLELLAGFGFTAKRLDPAPSAFDCAESCSHPNLCGYGKAVLEEVLTRGIRRLLLVDCCDVCRRIYDVLNVQGSMEFLFLMSLPHKNGPAECRLLTQELTRLQAELARLQKQSAPRQRESAGTPDESAPRLEESSNAPDERSNRRRLEAQSGLQNWNPDLALRSWKYNWEKARQMSLTVPHVRLTGAHGGALLKSMIQERMSLPVQDDTCTGRRELCRPADCPEISSGSSSALNFAGSPAVSVTDASTEKLWSLPSYAFALLNQKRPCMRMQFYTEETDPRAVGTICHTVKFCDYYSFQYRHLRQNKEETLLKIETDCTPQSSGQLRTRLDAFAETLNLRQLSVKNSSEDDCPVPGKSAATDSCPVAGKPAASDYFHNPDNLTTSIRISSGRFYTAGVDSGSTSTDAVILDQNGRIVGSSILPTGAGAAAGAEKALAAALEQACLNQKDLAAIITTGYGRSSIGISDISVTEITCHAKGAHFLYPSARTVIDIGGQDSKVIRIDEDGNVVNFVMNDKCAAGTGRFLEMMARTLELSLKEMSRLGLKWKNEISISSMCTVFAESEVVSLIADNTSPSDIIHGLNNAVAGKTLSLMKRLGEASAYIMTGGVSQNQGVVKALEEKLGASIYVPLEAQLCGALGAALIAAEQPGRNHQTL